MMMRMRPAPTPKAAGMREGMASRPIYFLLPPLPPPDALTPLLPPLLPSLTPFLPSRTSASDGPSGEEEKESFECQSHCSYYCLRKPIRNMIPSREKNACSDAVFREISMKPVVALILIDNSFIVKVDNLIKTRRQTRHSQVYGSCDRVRKNVGCCKKIHSWHWLVPLIERNQ